MPETNEYQGDGFARFMITFNAAIRPELAV